MHQGSKAAEGLSAWIPTFYVKDVDGVFKIYKFHIRALFS